MAPMLPLLHGLACAATADSSLAAPSLIELADKHVTDKALHLGHAYTSVYSMILDAKRNTVQNVTEIGVFQGASALMWADYFPSAQIWGLDIVMQQQAINRTMHEPRIHLHNCDATQTDTASKLQLAPESMDLIVEDASHGYYDSLHIIENFWPLVKPGGFYVIEDVNTGGDNRGKYSGPKEERDPPGFASIAHNATGALRRIYSHNDVFIADTLIGVDMTHSGFVRDQHRRHWLEDAVNHNWHMIVIRKRHSMQT